MEQEILKIKSANKCSWLLTKNHQPLYAAVDDDGMAYLAFEYNQSVQQCLNGFYRPETSIELGIYSFLRNYKIVRKMMRETLEEKIA